MEKLIHVISQGLHILAAITWIGSMIYSAFGVAPGLKALGSTKAQATNMLITSKFSWLSWTSLTLLILTGIYAVTDKSDKLAPTKPAGTVLIIKLILFAAMAVILIAQVFAYGPKMKKMLESATPKNQENQLKMNRLTGISNALSRAHLWAGIAVVILTVVLSQLLQ